MSEGTIKNFRELEFAIFCIENVAKELWRKCGTGISGIYRRKQYSEWLYHSGIRHPSYPEQVHCERYS